jgi:hypothetical protein
VLAASLLLFGLKMQLDQGRANLDPNASANKSADAGAGKWIRDHTDKDVVIMARHVPTVYHYSERKLSGFIANPQLLMKGIAKHKVDFRLSHTGNPPTIFHRTTHALRLCSPPTQMQLI